MFKFFFDVFCKDTAIGLCQIERSKRSKIYRNNYSKQIFSNKPDNNGFKCFTIDQTLCRA